MLKVTQLINSSIIHSNSIFSNSKTYILKLENPSKSPGGLIETQLLGLTPRVFDSVGIW